MELTVRSAQLIAAAAAMAAMAETDKNTTAGGLHYVHKLHVVALAEQVAVALT